MPFCFASRLHHTEQMLTRIKKMLDLYDQKLKTLLIVDSKQLELLKYAAIICMVLDHVAVINLENSENFLHSVIGRFVFPAFAFILVYNWANHTKNKLKYLAKLFITALISQPIFTYAFEYNPYFLNIIFTLFFGLMFIYLYENRRKLVGKSPLNKEIMSRSNPAEPNGSEENDAITLLMLYGLGLVGVISLFALHWVLSYSIFGLLMIFSFYGIMKNQKRQFAVYLILSLVLLNAPSASYIEMISTLLFFPVIGLIKLSGISIKRFSGVWFYLFYPVHLLILKLI